ncbi:MAG: YkgJ family cysteine cluster protein [Aquabacterium sp.]|uniref:YkgJ family cysteine cluster protein n=1 Tax=Aquabacterium sp. TaxID=1872578 RepID=UPI003BE9FE34
MLDCQRCGACCAAYRVSFYWAEATDGGGAIPVELTEPLNAHLCCMQGTSSKHPHCAALQGHVGQHVACGIYEVRPEPCRLVTAGDPQCLKARAAYGLPND